MALQWTVVAVAVLVAAVYSTWRLLPAGRRLRLLELLTPPAARLGLTWPQRARQRLLAGAGGGCAGCAEAGEHAPVRRKGLGVVGGRR